MCTIAARHFANVAKIVNPSHGILRQGRFYFPRLVSHNLCADFPLANSSSVMSRVLTLVWRSMQVQHATSGSFVALALYGPDAVKRWRTLIGPTHVYKAQWTHPETLRARYGLSDTRNGFHGEYLEQLKSKRGTSIYAKTWFAHCE